LSVTSSLRGRGAPLHQTPMLHLRKLQTNPRGARTRYYAACGAEPTLQRPKQATHSPRSPSWAHGSRPDSPVDRALCCILLGRRRRDSGFRAVPGAHRRGAWKLVGLPCTHLLSCVNSRFCGRPNWILSAYQFGQRVGQESRASPRSIEQARVSAWRRQSKPVLLPDELAGMNPRATCSVSAITVAVPGTDGSKYSVPGWSVRP